MSRDISCWGLEHDVVRGEGVNLDFVVSLDGGQDAVGGGQGSVSDVAYRYVGRWATDDRGQNFCRELEVFHVIAGCVHQGVGSALHLCHFGISGATSMVKVSPVETISTGIPASSMAFPTSTHICIQRRPSANRVSRSGSPLMD